MFKKIGFEIALEILVSLSLSFLVLYFVVVYRLYRSAS